MLLDGILLKIVEASNIAAQDGSPTGCLGCINLGWPHVNVQAQEDTGVYSIFAHDNDVRAWRLVARLVRYHGSRDLTIGKGLVNSWIGGLPLESRNLISGEVYIDG